jgi:hypothetical protein
VLNLQWFVEVQSLKIAVALCSEAEISLIGDLKFGTSLPDSTDYAFKTLFVTRWKILVLWLHTWMFLRVFHSFVVAKLFAVDAVYLVG